MELVKLLERLEYEVIQGTKEIEIAKVVSDSEDAEKDALFICITGMVFDGCDFIKDAVGKGAVAVVVEKEIEAPPGICVIRVKDTRYALARIAAAFYDYPAEKITTVGVTGTKGKTTTACMIYEILKQQTNHKLGLVGTMGVWNGERKIPAKHTSPESLFLKKNLREMVDAGCDIVVMEVSSQGLKLHMTDEIYFDIGIFTNLGKDHIGKYEHVDFEEYKQCKAKLFRQCKLGILNKDDPYWKDMIRDASCKIETFGFQNCADYKILKQRMKKEMNGLGAEYEINGERFCISMPGKFNIYNSTAAYAACKNLGIQKEKIQKVLAHVQVCGRVERISMEKEHDFTVMIDYAHNAMSLQSVLEMIHSYNPKRIVTIFGCGGGRAKDRRYEMGRVSGQMSDLTIITSDNPRYEEPLKIMQDIRTGIEKTEGKYVEIRDRREAVRYALFHARKGDVILLAGKGHEDYQEIKGIRYHMDDHEIVRETMKELEYVRRYHH